MNILKNEPWTLIHISSNHLTQHGVCFRKEMDGTSQQEWGGGGGGVMQDFCVHRGIWSLSRGFILTEVDQTHF